MAIDEPWLGAASNNAAKARHDDSKSRLTCRSVRRFLTFALSLLADTMSTRKRIQSSFSRGLSADSSSSRSFVTTAKRCAYLPAPMPSFDGPPCPTLLSRSSTAAPSSDICPSIEPDVEERDCPCIELWK